MGCGLLEIINELKNEVLLFWDKDKGLIIIVDVSIYNKKELCCLFNIEYDKEMSIIDS